MLSEGGHGVSLTPHQLKFLHDMPELLGSRGHDARSTRIHRILFSTGFVVEIKGNYTQFSLLHFLF